MANMSGPGTPKPPDRGPQKLGEPPPLPGGQTTFTGMADALMGRNTNDENPILAPTMRMIQNIGTGQAGGGIEKIGKLSKLIAMLF